MTDTPDSSLSGRRWQKRRFNMAGPVLLVAVTVGLVTLPSYVTSSYHMGIIIQTLMMGYLATCWGLVGQTGQLSFGHAAFVGIGAYTSTILYTQFGVNPWLNMVLGGAMAVAFGIIIGVPTLRLRGVYFALATLAFAFVLQIFVRNTFDIGPIFLGASPGIPINLVNGGDAPWLFQFRGKVPYFYVILAMLAGVLALSWQLNQRRTGHYWTAIRNDPDAAEALGIEVGHYRIYAFVLSCFLSGAGGVFYSQYLLSVDPRRVLDLSLSLDIVAMGVVGGWQTVFGPILGAMVLAPLGEVLRTQLYTMPQLTVILFGIAIVLFIRFLPDGLMGPLAKLLARIDSRLRGDR